MGGHVSTAVQAALQSEHGKEAAAEEEKHKIDETIVTCKRNRPSW